MGKYLDKFRKKEKQIIDNTRRFRDKAQEFGDRKLNEKRPIQEAGIKKKEVNYRKFDDDFYDDFDDDFKDLKDNPYEPNIQPAQKPASFHHFLLENRYQDLEMDVRGYKYVYNKYTEKWEIKKRERHCFTPEEAENIIRMIQSHLSTDIKLTTYQKDTFGFRFEAIKGSIRSIFRDISEYNFGRFADDKEQYDMKLQAFKIYLQVLTRIEANYLMAVGGNENKLTHQSVQSQESLQGERQDDFINRRYQ